MNGISGITDVVEQRWAAKVVGTQRVKLAGHHQFKAGVDGEGDYLDNARGVSGGASFTTRSNTQWNIIRYVDPRSGTDWCAGHICTYLPNLVICANTMNLGAFLQDSWSIFPNLTMNVGLRYEQQYLKYADSMRKTIDPITEKPVGDNALQLTNLWAPRLGLVYDWTKEGRSKLYANWVRFYESIPMDINDRSLGGEDRYDELWAVNRCGAKPTGENAPN
jgi:outer membrane receptor protein involved in Fe transport